MEVIVDGDEVYSEYTAPGQTTVTTDPVSLPNDQLVSLGYTYDPDTGHLQTAVTDLTDPAAPTTTFSDPVDANLPHPLSIATVQVGSVHNDGETTMFVDDLVVYGESMDETAFSEQTTGYGDQGRTNVVAYATFDDDVTDDSGTGSIDTPTMTVVTDGK